MIATDVRVADGYLQFKMGSISHLISLQMFPRLAHATDRQQINWRLIGQGEGIHWPEVDEDLSFDGILKRLGGMAR